MKRVILDTNFLIYCIKEKIHIEVELSRILDSSFKIALIDKTIDELKKLTRESKTKDSAQIALKIATKYELIETTEEENQLVDDLILKNLKKDDIVATMDRELQKQLKHPYIVIRQKKYLSLK